MPGLTIFPPASCAAFRADLRSLRQSFTSVLEFESPLLMVLFVALGSIVPGCVLSVSPTRLSWLVPLTREPEIVPIDEPEALAPSADTLPDWARAAVARPSERTTVAATFFSMDFFPKHRQMLSQQLTGPRCSARLMGQASALPEAQIFMSGPCIATRLCVIRRSKEECPSGLRNRS